MSREITIHTWIHAWIHSHADTGKPLEVDVFEIQGHMHMGWFNKVFTLPDAASQVELAEQFHAHLGRVDDSAWFAIKCKVEDAVDQHECYPEILAVIECANWSGGTMNEPREQGND